MGVIGVCTVVVRRGGLDYRGDSYSGLYPDCRVHGPSFSMSTIVHVVLASSQSADVTSSAQHIHLIQHGLELTLYVVHLPLFQVSSPLVSSTYIKVLYCDTAVPTRLAFQPALDAPAKYHLLPRFTRQRCSPSINTPFRCSYTRRRPRPATC